ncbi:hypothetical protein [Sorangium sp. So ce388]|uniref:hypothetical protein n=1 Tax=Sorangium sp. So ce388 TaxID=3133309 RepID=UPI003F5B7BCD
MRLKSNMLVAFVLSTAPLLPACRGEENSTGGGGQGGAASGQGGAPSSQNGGDNGSGGQGGAANGHGGQGGAANGYGGQGGAANGHGGAGGAGGAECHGTEGGGEAGGLPECNQNPAPAIGDVLDPGEVYLIGDILEASCSYHALTHYSSPFSAVGGFGIIDGTSPIIRPTDGRLVYVNTIDQLDTYYRYPLREFHCDECPYRHDITYECRPLDNDTAISTPPCNPEDGIDFRISPSGDWVYKCIGELNTWHDGSGAGEVDALKYEGLFHLGYEGTVFTRSKIIHLRSGTSFPIVGLPVGQIYTVRAKAPGSFLLALAPDTPMPEGGSTQLWEVDACGTANLLGTYPPLPTGVQPVPQSNHIKLESCGALVQIGWRIHFVPGGDCIVRREVGGVSEIVYDAMDLPTVRLNGASLVTGP